MPVQSELNNSDTIRFSRNDYSYELTPVYGYEISGLIASKMNYQAFSLEKFEKVFPLDLCLIWGSNVANGAHRNREVLFSQDCRWCMVWVRQAGIKFNYNELSNNHLLISDPGLERKAKSLLVGDQVKIIGKLVNVKANLVGKPGSFDAAHYTLKSSTNREDKGAGACEVIYVEDIEVLKKANVAADFLFHISLYAIIGLVVWKALRFFSIIKLE
ncbi:MAG: hypothetical protein PHG68_05350 [Candidatus Omnitrophica bacterium]|nr:hypothetical protein [Candidatus Omnitrophota bacterium]